MVSGVVNSLDGIRQGLLKSGHQPYIFAPEFRDFRDIQSQVYRFPSLEVFKRISFPIPIPYSTRLFRVLRELQLDLIHSHHPFMLGEVAASVARQKQIPLIYTFHTQVEHYSHYVPMNQNVVRGVARSKIIRYLNKCDLVIAPSSGIRGLLDTYGSKARIETLPNAIDLDRFSELPSGKNWREKLRIPDLATVSLSVGRLEPEKSLDFLLKAFRKTNPTPDQILVVVGDGTQRARLIKLSQSLGLGANVRFPGAVAYSEMPSLYTSSDLLAICSTTEVKPLVVLEALACGLPVLAVSACGTADTLHHGRDGWLCPNDLDSFVNGWSTLLADRTMRRDLGTGALRTARNYSFTSYLTRLISLYQETMATHQPQRKSRSYRLAFPGRATLRGIKSPGSL